MRFLQIVTIGHLLIRCNQNYFNTGVGLVGKFKIEMDIEYRYFNVSICQRYPTFFSISY